LYIMKKDDILLNEAYNKVINQQLDEDLGSFLKTVGGDVVRGIGGTAKKAALGTQKGYSKLKQMGMGALAGASGRDPRAVGKGGQPSDYSKEGLKQGELTKKSNEVDREYTANRLTQYLNSMLTGVIRDVKYLGLGVEDLDSLKQELFDTFKKHLMQSGTIKYAGSGKVGGGQSKAAVKLNPSSSSPDGTIKKTMQKRIF
jgi:hypothetical protein